MPTLSHSQLPLPKSWDEFEDIVVSAINAQKPHSTAQRFGRIGQAQNGVDIYFEDSAARRTGVQCKLVESLTIDDIKAEITKAEHFRPSLESYMIAFGGKRDAALQKQVYTLSNERFTTSQFRMQIWFWEDIAFFLSRDPAELARHFPQLYAPSPAPPKAILAGLNEVQIPRSGTRDEFMSHDFDITEFKKPLPTANDALFCGISLIRVIQQLDYAIEQGLHAGLRASFVLLNPKNRQAVEMAAFRNLHRKNVSEVLLTLHEALSRLTILSQIAKDTPGSLEIRLVNYIVPYTIMALDPDLPTGIINVRLMSFRYPNDRRPSFTLRGHDGEWFQFFRDQARLLWKHGAAFDQPGQGRAG